MLDETITLPEMRGSNRDELPESLQKVSQDRLFCINIVLG